MGSVTNRGASWASFGASGWLDRRLARKSTTAMDHSFVRPLVRRVDGWHSIEIGPREISFGEDQNTRQVDGKRGHLSGTLSLWWCSWRCYRQFASACDRRWASLCPRLSKSDAPELSILGVRWAPAH